MTTFHPSLTIQVGAIALALVPVSIMPAFTLLQVVLAFIVMLVFNGIGDADAHHPGIGAGVHCPGVHIAIVLASVVVWVLDGVSGVRHSSELIRQHKPDVIAVGGFLVLTVKLWERVGEVIGYGEHQDSFGKDDPGANTSAEGDEAPPKESSDLIPIIWAPDQVACIFQHSRCTAEDFGSLLTIG